MGKGFTDDPSHQFRLQQSLSQHRKPGATCFFHLRDSLVSSTKDFICAICKFCFPATNVDAQKNNLNDLYVWLSIMTTVWMFGLASLHIELACCSVIWTHCKTCGVHVCNGMLQEGQTFVWPMFRCDIWTHA